MAEVEDGRRPEGGRSHKAGQRPWERDGHPVHGRPCLELRRCERTRDDENLEKWALYEEYKIFEDAYYEYESDWVRELQEKWEEQNDENEIIKPTEN